MKTISIFILILFLSGSAISQKALDLAVETPENRTERNVILNTVEELMSLEEDIIFDVTHLKISKDYAWFQGNVLLKDGTPLELRSDFLDCCHVEGLFEKKNGIWEEVSFAAFSTDCWYCGISKEYPKVPKKIFPKGI